MEPEKPRSAPARVIDATRKGAKAALGTSWFLLRIMVPVSLAVALLGWSGALEYVARFLKPVMGLMGLPGEAALAFISGALLNNYSAIAVMGSLSLDMRDVTILAMMSLTAHNLLIETTVMRKIGSSAAKMLLLRVSMALVSGFVFNLILPASLSKMPFSVAASASRPVFLDMLGAWAVATLILVAKIGVIVLIIMIAQRLLEEFRVMGVLSRVFAPLMRVFGLSRESSFLWIIINVVGYAYGAGVIEEQIESGRMKRTDGDLFNHHAAICHSLLEDTALYMALGVPMFWITVPRIVLAIVVVWAERGRRHYFRRSFRAGVA